MLHPGRKPSAFCSHPRFGGEPCLLPAPTSFRGRANRSLAPLGVGRGEIFCFSPWLRGRSTPLGRSERAVVKAGLGERRQGRSGWFGARGQLLPESPRT